AQKFPGTQEEITDASHEVQWWQRGASYSRPVPPRKRSVGRGQNRERFPRNRFLTVPGHRTYVSPLADARSRTLPARHGGLAVVDTDRRPATAVARAIY